MIPVRTVQPVRGCAPVIGYGVRSNYTYCLDDQEIMNLVIVLLCNMQYSLFARFHHSGVSLNLAKIWMEVFPNFLILSFQNRWPWKLCISALEMVNVLCYNTLIYMDASLRLSCDEYEVPFANGRPFKGRIGDSQQPTVWSYNSRNAYLFVCLFVCLFNRSVRADTLIGPSHHEGS